MAKITYKNLDELKQAKEVLKKSIAQEEHLLKFEDKKASLSLLTNGKTDPYLNNEIRPDGEVNTSVDTRKIKNEVIQKVKNNLLNTNPVTKLVNGSMEGEDMETLIRTGAVLGVAALARSNMRSKDWRKKLLGAAIIYIGPLLIRYGRQRLGEYQRERSVSSLEKII